MCDKVMEHLEKHEDKLKIAHVGIIKLDKIYYKHDSIYIKTKEALKGKPEKLNDLYFLEKPSHEVVSEIVANVLTHGDRKMKIKATLL